MKIILIVMLFNQPAQFQQFSTMQSCTVAAQLIMADATTQGDAAKAEGYPYTPHPLARCVAR